MSYISKNELFDQQRVLQLTLSEPQSIPESSVAPPDGQWPVKNNAEMRLWKKKRKAGSGSRLDLFKAV